MDHYEARLRELGVTLPTLPKPIANYVPAKRSGNLVFTAGQVSSANEVEYKGKLGDNLAVADAQAATRACVINCLAAIKAQIGSLGRIKQVLAVHGLVNRTLECGDQALAMNGASDLSSISLETPEGTFARRQELRVFQWGLQRRPI